MRKTIFISMIAVLAILSSCENNEEILDKQSTTVEQNSKGKILQERDPKYPLILSKKKSKTRAIPNDPVYGLNSLGRGFKLDYFPIETGRNIGYPVIDIDKLYKDYPSYFFPNPIFESKTNYFSFSSFSKYAANSKTTEKISTGFSLNLGIFSIGSKRTIENIFSKAIANENKRVFGEMNINVTGTSYELQMSESIKSRIKERYIHPAFMEELYESPMNEVVQNYGAFVLRSFYTGGRVTAYYTGKYSGNHSEASVENSMQKTMTASVKVNVQPGVDGKVSGELGIGGQNGNGSSTTVNLEDIQISVSSTGGIGSGSFSTAKSLSEINLNFSQWLGSLNKENMVLMEINKNGLLPITDFILEANFKRQINNYLAGYSFAPEYTEPYIEINANGNEEVYFFGTHLITRYNDLITFDATQRPCYGMDTAALKNDYIQRQFNKYKGKYRIKIKADVNNFHSQLKIKTDANNFYSPLKIKTDANNFYSPHIYMIIDESKMKKFTHPRNGLTYLLYSEGNKKYGYSIYDDFILDTYGIRDWVEKLPTTNISLKELNTYTIVAL